MKKQDFIKLKFVLKFIFCVLCTMLVLQCISQKNYGVSQDYYMYRNRQSLIVPLVFYETKNSWFTSVRYNYEESKTLSLQSGKKFSKDGGIPYSITPLIGILTGKYNGLSLATQAEIEAGKFSFYTEPEYCIGLNNSVKKFLYNWSEFSVQPSKHFYTGLALQTVKYKFERLDIQPGLMFGIIANNFEIPFYFFNPTRSSNYFVAGVHWKLEKE